MQLAGSMNLGEGIITAAVSAALGWFVSSFSKVNKADFKELTARVANLETGRITREEFERDMSGLRELIRDFRTELRADMKEIKSKV